jgi:hypothetical protein
MLVIRNGAIAGVEISAIPCAVIASAPSEKLRNPEISPLVIMFNFPRFDEGSPCPRCST